MVIIRRPVNFAPTEYRNGRQSQEINLRYLCKEGTCFVKGIVTQYKEFHN